MEVDTLKSLVLSLPEVQSSVHMDVPDFRVNGKIFATLPSNQHLVLKLTVEQQKMVISSDPGLFAPVDDAWGERGWTIADIAALDEAEALSSVIMAWTNVSPEITKKKHG